MKRLLVEGKKEAALFKEMRKVIPYLKCEIYWSDLKKHRQEMRIERFAGIDS